jgi:hypothetical protein
VNTVRTAVGSRKWRKKGCIIMDVGNVDDPVTSWIAAAFMDGVRD